jgi:hypothetical protein
MNFKEKFKVIENNKDLFFLLKMGKLIEYKNSFYQTPKWVSNIFYFYYYSGIAFILYLIIFYFMVSIFKSIYIGFIFALLIVFGIEFLYFILIPMKIIQRWKAYSRKKSIEHVRKIG